MARSWGPAVPITLLVAAGVGFGVLGARAIRLEGDEAARRARARAEEVVRSAAAVAPTRAAEGLGTPTDAFTLVPPRAAGSPNDRPDVDPVPDDARLLLDQALYLERRGDAAGAAAMYRRVADRDDLGAVAEAARVHAWAADVRSIRALDDAGPGAAGRAAGIAPGAVRVIEAAAFVPPSLPAPANGAASLDGVPLGVWMAYLRLLGAVDGRAPIDQVRAAIVDFLATPGVEGVRTDGGPDAADCVLCAIDAIGPRLDELPRPTREDLLRAKARALVAHRLVHPLEDAPIAAAGGFVAAKDRANPALVRLVPVATFSAALSDALKTT